RGWNVLVAHEGGGEDRRLARRGAAAAPRPRPGARRGGGFLPAGRTGGAAGPGTPGDTLPEDVGAGGLPPYLLAVLIEHGHHARFAARQLASSRLIVASAQLIAAG